MSKKLVQVIVTELNRRIMRSAAKANRKQREYQFQDERIHRARAGALAEFLGFIEFAERNIDNIETNQRRND